MIVWIPLKRANQERTGLDGIQRAAVVKKISSMFVPNSKFLKEPLLGGGNQFGLIPKIRKSLEKKWETAVKNPSATVYSKPQNLIDDNRLGYFFRLFFTGRLTTYETHLELIEKFVENAVSRIASWRSPDGTSEEGLCTEMTEATSQMVHLQKKQQPSQLNCHMK